MHAHKWILTERERIENALDQLASLRDQVRSMAQAAGRDASAIFAKIDTGLHEELSQPRPSTPALAEIARRLRELRASIRPR